MSAKRPRAKETTHRLRPSVIDVIETCSLLNALKDEERLNLAEKSFLAFAERGETIWLAGGPSHFVGIVGNGFVKMTRTTIQGSEVAMELLGPGQCFGLFAAIEGRAYPLTATAVTTTWYVKIPTRVLIEVYNNSSAFKDQIVRSLGPRLRRAHDMMARMAASKVEQRIAAVLLILIDSYGEKTDQGVRINVPLTRQDLSEMAGTTVETSIRTMSKWQKAGIIATDHQMITVVSPSALDELLIV
jgi:CRP-like cAMP-binding protein